MSNDVNPDAGTEGQSYTVNPQTDMLPKEQWPSHARRFRRPPQDGTSFCLHSCPHFLQSTTHSLNYVLYVLGCRR